MIDQGVLAALYVGAALLFHLVLVVHFAIRRWRFETAVRRGWIVYALSIPFAAVSIVLVVAGAPWWMYLGGVLYLAWAGFGYVVEYVRRIEWRRPIKPAIFVPYLLLYLATSMFYWWPLARVGWPFWLAATVLFVVATVLNVSSHRPRAADQRG